VYGRQTRQVLSEGRPAGLSHEPSASFVEKIMSINCLHDRCKNTFECLYHRYLVAYGGEMLSVWVHEHDAGSSERLAIAVEVMKTIKTSNPRLFARLCRLAGDEWRVQDTLMRTIHYEKRESYPEWARKQGENYGSKHLP
jgi:hypothetical protein